MSSKTTRITALSAATALTMALLAATATATASQEQSVQADGAIATQPAITDSLAEAWRWVHFSTASGLPGNSVVNLTETPAGTVWAATDRGLAWYKGFRWHPVGPGQGVPADSLRSIAAHLEDEILAVVGRGLYRGNQDGFEPVSVEVGGVVFQALDVTELSNRRAVVLGTRDEDSPILAFTYEDGLIEPLDLPAPINANQDAEQIWSNRAGAVWLNTVEGLARWGGQRWEIRVPNPGETLGVQTMVETADGTGAASIWFPDGLRGLWEWSGDLQPELSLSQPADLLQSMDISPRGNVLVVYRSGDVRIRQGDRWLRVQHLPPQMGGLLFVRFRADGDFWVGTPRGLFLFRASHDRWTHWEVFSPDFRNELLELLLTSDGSLWVATAQGIAIHRPDGAIDWIEEINGISLRQITGLAEDAEGGIWASSGGSLEGAFRWDGVAWQHFAAADGLLAPLVHRIRKDRRGRLWFLGMADVSNPEPEPEPGAFLLDEGRFVPWGPTEGLLHGRVYDFSEAPDGAYWFATGGGLSRWRAGDWTHWTLREGLARSRIFTLEVDTQGRAWFGDQANGLGFIDDDDSPGYLTTADGLIHDAVQDLGIGPNGELWISTSGGLSSYRDGEWLNYGISTGLSSPSLWPILPATDRVYVGTSGNGLDILSLAEATVPSPRVVLDPILVAEHSVLIGWDTAAFWGQMPAEAIETRFRIDGRDWSEWSTNRRDVLTDIAAGEHFLEVQAKSLFGGPSEPIGVDFTALRPFYLRGLFLVPLGVLLLSSIALFTSRLRHVRALRRRDTELRRSLEESVAERTEALRQSEERLRLLLETSHVIPWEADAKTWQFTYVGPQAVRILGYPVERWYEPSFWVDHIHPADVDDAVRYCSDHARNIGQYEFDYRMIAADKRVVWLHDLVTVVLKNGEPVTLRGFMIDITERKQAEAERIEAESEALEHRERLAHMSRLNMLGEMATGIAHEVNQPLTAVSTYTQACRRLLKAGKIDQEQLIDVLARISNEAVRAGDMIHGLKTLVRKRRSEMHICNVNELVRDVFPLADAEARQRGVDVALDLNDSVLDIAADAVQIQQVILNLIRNAIEASEPTHGVVRVRSETLHGDLIEVEVADNGLGVEDDPDRVFQPFFSTKEDGMGMGLSISRTIIEAHGGRIGHRPSELGGSAFFFQLPAEQQRISAAS